MKVLDGGLDLPFLIFSPFTHGLLVLFHLLPNLSTSPLHLFVICHRPLENVILFVFLTCGFALLQSLQFIAKIGLCLHHQLLSFKPS
jgi:hypothetical protein